MMLVNCVTFETAHLFGYYADDILLITSSVSELQSLVTACEELLLGLDMSLNVGKSSCIRIGPRYDKIAAPVLLYMILMTSCCVIK